MSYGLRIENPSGVLVLDSEAIHYRFHSKPSPYAAGSYYYPPGSALPAYLNAVTYRVTVSGSMPPIVFLRPEAGKVSAVKQVTNLGGGVWEIEVYCVNIAGSWPEDMRSGVPADVPQVYVFAPMAASGEAYGMQLFNGAGQVTFDTGFRPLWLRGAVAFSALTGDWNSGAMAWSSSTANAHFNGDQQPVTDAETLLVMGSTLSVSRVTIATIGEPADIWGYGWTIMSGALSRHRFWVSSDRYFHTLDWSTDDVVLQLGACVAVIARSTDYD